MALGAFNLGSNLGFPNPHVLDATVRQWEPDPNDFIFSTILPMENWPFEIIEWDEEDPITGITPAHTLDTDPFLRKARGRKHNQQLTAYWAESWRLRQSDIHRVRALMAYDRLAGEELVMGETRASDLRLEARIELLRVQALKGSITINSNGVIRTIPYALPAGNTPTAGTLWSDTANSKPVANVLTWARNFRGVGGAIKCYYNQIIAELLAANASVIDLFKQSPMVGELSPANVGKLMSTLCSSKGRPIEFIPYDEGYTADNGDYTPFMGDTEFLMICDPPKGQKMGAFKTTPDIRNAESESFTPRPGKFVVVENKLKTKNPYYEQTQGINGLPTVRFPKCRLLATVAA